MGNSLIQLGLTTTLFKTIIDRLMEELLYQEPDKEVEENVVYNNSPESIKLCWTRYHRTCLFTLCFENSDELYMQCYMDNSGFFEMEFYPNGSFEKRVSVQENLMSEEEAELVYMWLKENVDDKGIVNPTIEDVAKDIQSEVRYFEIENLLEEMNSAEETEDDLDSIKIN